MNTQIMGHNRGCSKRKVQRTKCLYKEISESLYQQFNTTLEKSRKKKKESNIPKRIR